MKKYFYFLIIAITSLFSCNFLSKKQKGNWITLNDTVAFNVGFPSANINYSEYNEKEYIAFADFRTTKKIVLFDIQGKLLYAIPVDKLLENGKTILISFDIISPDSIALLTAYTNNVLLINSMAEMIYKKDYSPLLLEGIELWTPICFDKKFLRVCINYLDHNLPKYPSKEDFVNSNARGLSFYNLMADTAFYTDAKPILQLDSIYCRFASEKQFTTEGNHILMLDSLNIFYSAYSDTLYVYNLAGQLKKTVVVKSDYTTTRINPITYEQYWQDNELLNRNFLKNGFIDKLLWDKYRNLYYCFVRSKMIEKKLPFSIIIFDKDFKKLDEIEMDYNKFYPTAFVGENGLYVKQAYNDDFKINKFTLFRYE